MPTADTFLLAALLIIAAASGFAFKIYSDRDRNLPPRISADYIRGLNLVLNRKTDEALELFVQMAKVDEDTLETHFALGHLFRRRGEGQRQPPARARAPEKRRAQPVRRAARRVDTRGIGAGGARLWRGHRTLRAGHRRRPAVHLGGPAGAHEVLSGGGAQRRPRKLPSAAHRPRRLSAARFRVRGRDRQSDRLGHARNMRRTFRVRAPGTCESRKCRGAEGAARRATPPR